MIYLARYRENLYMNFREAFMERSLHQFLAVAETGSISAASKQLNVTQPTITVNIKNLEDKHQVELFERSSRGMRLTSFGSILYEKTRVMARLETQASQEIENLRTGEREIIGVGCGHAWWDLFVYDSIEKLKSDLPNASIYVENGSNLNCMWKLLAGEIIVSVGHHIRNLVPGISAEFIPLFKAKDAYYVSSDNPILSKECTKEDLLNLRWISSAPKDRRYSEILLDTDSENYEKIFNPSGSPSYSSNSILTCADMVKRTGGYTVYPIDMRDSFAELGLTPLSINSPIDSQQVGIYYLSERRNEPALQKLLNSITICAERYASDNTDRNR